MWFKNINAYNISNFDLTAEQLAEKISERIFTPCKPIEEKQVGWVSPFGDKFESLVHSSMGCHLFCFKSEEKILPAAVVNEIVQQRIDELRKNDPEIKKVKKEVKQRIAEQVRQELLPKALSKFSRIMAYIDTKQGLLIVDSSSQSKAENIILMLRSSLDENIKFSPVRVIDEPSIKMSDWLLKQTNPSEVEFGEKCQLKDPVDLGSIRYAKHNMEDAKLQQYLEEGKTVAELELTWDEKIKFVLTEDLVIKGIKFLDLIKEQLEEQSPESYEEAFDIEFTVMHGAFGSFIPFIFDCFGGIVVEEVV
jgi:DNA recombination-dependent growth factor C